MPELKQAIDRVREMEARFDRIRENTPCQTDLEILLDYYQNGLWRSDFELDEQGLFPPELKRGILSEDGFYNFLQEAEL